MVSIVIINNEDKLIVFGGENDDETHDIINSLSEINTLLRSMVCLLSQSKMKIDWLFLVAKIDLFQKYTICSLISKMSRIYSSIQFFNSSDKDA